MSALDNAKAALSRKSISNPTSLSLALRALIAEHERLLVEQAASQEWEYGFGPGCDGYVWARSEEFARSFVAQYPNGWRLMRRTKEIPAGPWEPVPQEGTDR